MPAPSIDRPVEMERVLNAMIKDILAFLFRRLSNLLTFIVALIVFFEESSHISAYSIFATLCLLYHYEAPKAAIDYIL